MVISSRDPCHGDARTAPAGSWSLTALPCKCELTPQSDAWVIGDDLWITVVGEILVWGWVYLDDESLSGGLMYIWLM